MELRQSVPERNECNVVRRVTEGNGHAPVRAVAPRSLSLLEPRSPQVLGDAFGQLIACTHPDDEAVVVRAVGSVQVTGAHRALALESSRKLAAVADHVVAVNRSYALTLAELEDVEQVRGSRSDSAYKLRYVETRDLRARLVPDEAGRPVERPARDDRDRQRGFPGLVGDLAGVLPLAGESSRGGQTYGQDLVVDHGPGV